MSQMKETAICPVSFIDNKIVTDKDINGLFMNPYNYKINFDQCCGAMISDIQRNYEDKIPEHLGTGDMILITLLRELILWLSKLIWLPIFLI